MILKKGGLRLKNRIKKDNDFYPLVSIITVVRNGEKYLKQTINSVLNQSYRNIEYLIIDGDSKDKTLKIIKKYNNKIDYWISQKDNGLWDAMNKGIKLASGSIIGIINSDDIYNKNAVKTAVNYLKNNFDFVFGSVQKYKLLTGFKPWKVKFSFGFYTSHSVGFFIKTKAQKKVGLYNNQFLSADLDFFYKMIIKHKLIGTSSKKGEVFGKFRPGGFSSKINYLDHLRDLNKIRIHNGQNKFYVYCLFIFKIIKNLNKARKAIWY
jgi:glycosyltransferase involved in cell wall biosynthesis